MKTEQQYEEQRIECAIDTALLNADLLREQVAELEAELAQKSLLIREMDLMFGRMLLGMRAAVIEEEHGKGAENAMMWIFNGLVGPGELPPEEETDAQAYFDREVTAIDEGMKQIMDERKALGAAPAPVERNQCDGCQAGIPVENGMHRMGKPGGYADLMACTADRYGYAPVERVEQAGAELDSRLRKAGMTGVAELLKGAPLDAFIKHAGVNDLGSLLQWAEMRRAECLRAMAQYDLGEKDKSDDMYEWTVAHCAAFTELHVNLRAAIATPQSAAPAPDVAGLVEALEAIADPITALHKRLAPGEKLDGAMAVTLTADPWHYRKIAIDALAAHQQREGE